MLAAEAGATVVGAASEPSASGSTGFVDGSDGSVDSPSPASGSVGSGSGTTISSWAMMVRSVEAGALAMVTTSAPAALGSPSSLAVTRAALAPNSVSL